MACWLGVDHDTHTLHDTHKPQHMLNRHLLSVSTGSFNKYSNKVKYCVIIDFSVLMNASRLPCQGRSMKPLRGLLTNTISYTGRRAHLYQWFESTEIVLSKSSCSFNHASRHLTLCCILSIRIILTRIERMQHKVK